MVGNGTSGGGVRLDVRLPIGALFSVLGVLLAAYGAATQRPARLDALKREAVQDVEARGQLTQQINDQIFSFGELGFQEVETSRYLVNLLRQNGFTVQEGVAGIPTAWVATWGSGKPVIALGSDLHDIPQASQFPAVACHLPMVDGAPGHGEGHNSGQAGNIPAPPAVKRLMERDHLPGTIRLWPGVAGELIGTKAYYVRDGLFKDVDIVLFSHVGSNPGTSWGQGAGSRHASGLFSFHRRRAH